MEVVSDLLNYYPRNYLDRTNVIPIGQLKVDQTATIIGTVKACGVLHGRRRRYEVILDDETGAVALIWFQGVRYWERLFKKGQIFAATGVLSWFMGLQMVHPDLERLEKDSDKMVHAGRIIPVYPQTAELGKVGLNSKSIRRLTSFIFDNLTERITDHVPENEYLKLKLPSRHDAIVKIHYPDSRDEVEISRRQLTSGQKKVIKEIFDNLQSPHPMSRLLQGDVGCGKTVVAVLAAVYVAENNLQTAFMAPTEILAAQHYNNWKDLLAGIGITSALLTSSLKASEKKKIAKQCADGKIDILFGTHALIYDYVVFAKLGLVIIDEQHRFGVAQRAKLHAKGDNPDLLVMTATPIPRTLALTLYGDLDISTIGTMPPGRKPVRTIWRTDDVRKKVFEYVVNEVEKGGKAYIIYPLIEKSDQLNLVNVEDAFKELSASVFGNFKVGMVHGRVKPRERDKLLKKFREGELDILMATTVIEVGIDNPQATIMVIENAERFGLAQLHQLRGRIGRGIKPATLVALAHLPISDIGKKRLEYFTQTTDGFKISEADLELRGPGEVFGVRQSGLPELRIASLTCDVDLIESSRHLLERIFRDFKHLDRDYTELYNYLDKMAATKGDSFGGG